MDHFNEAIGKTLKNEGGYVNDPKDPGGETRYGISKRAYPNLDISNLTVNQAVAIYKKDYWLKPGLNNIVNGELACRMFDLGVNCGTFRAVTFLQNALNLLGFSVAVDGVLGSKTIKVVNDYRHPKALLAAVKHFAGRHYIEQNKPGFLAGWFSRLED